MAFVVSSKGVLTIMANAKVAFGTSVRVVSGRYEGQRGVVTNTRASLLFPDEIMLEVCSNVVGTFRIHDSQVVVDNTPVAPVRKPAVDTTGFEAIMEMVFPGIEGALFDAP